MMCPAPLMHAAAAIRPIPAAAVLACMLLSACATEHLGTTAPKDVNLTGEWTFNPNLSDEPDKLGGDADRTPQRSPGSHRGHGRGSGGGMIPMGSSVGGDYALLRVSLVSAARFPKAPQHLSITQKEGNVVIRTNMPDGTQTVDEYTAGTSATVPYGQDSTAKRSAGWRGPVFVITTTTKEGGAREDDLALDESGRLIVTTDMQIKRRSIEIKRVYDRVAGGPE